MLPLPELEGREGRAQDRTLTFFLNPIRPERDWGIIRHRHGHVYFLI